MCFVSASYFLSIFELSGVAGSIVSGVISDWLWSRASVPVTGSAIRMRLVKYYCVTLLVSLQLLSNHVDKTTPHVALMSLALVGNVF